MLIVGLYVVAFMAPNLYSLFNFIKYEMKEF